MGLKIWNRLFWIMNILDWRAFLSWGGGGGRGDRWQVLVPILKQKAEYSE
jgi:hypothetical protein